MCVEGVVWNTPCISHSSAGSDIPRSPPNNMLKIEYMTRCLTYIINSLLVKMEILESVGLNDGPTYCPDRQHSPVVYKYIIYYYASIYLISVRIVFMIIF